ncbi:carbohydrate ABC transporter permease [Actinotalea sp. BY-33]|uniref:Carbohydrate ABC transporter permease n=1 Tax=Actinotalea soli TaxID=2819234 RepID=A0A939LQE7_9CELL|nr:carbohydrate ABC transporter permease [Actinotalea soli]MBO1752129.1 carbohydrate ABC transporter permease [Actinotalea soli]
MTISVRPDTMDPAAPPRRPRRSTVSRVIAYVLLSLGALACLLPFLWMLSTSLKSSTEIFSFEPSLLPEALRWENYVRLFEALPMARMLLNSVFVTLTVTLGQVTFCCTAGYAFARLKFPGRDKLFVLYLGTMMVPFMVTLVPAYAIIRELGWINTYWALIVPQFFGSAYGTFLMRQFFMTLPQELEDAATIDGCGPLRIFWKIFLPLTKPAVATLAVFNILGVWNDFLWPLLVIQDNDLKTLPIGLATFQGLYATDHSLLMAGAVVSLIPMLIAFLFAQKYFVEGIALSGMKA